MDNFLVLGGNSRLASTLKTVLPNKTIYVTKNECDICSERDLQKVFNKYSFKYIINCVAITDITFCEKNQKECFDVNTIGVIKLGKLCKIYNKKLIHISSNYAVNPINIYGASKYLSEELLDSTALVIRTTFYDRKNYMIRSLLAHKSVEAYENLFFNPISINRLVAELISHKNDDGILNIFSSKKLSYYEFAQKICRVFNLPKALVKKSNYANNYPPYRPLNAFVKSDIDIEVIEDLLLFKQKIGDIFN